MRFELAVRRRRASIGLTPLIDVVFILLLFFLLASQFHRHGALQLRTPGLAVAPPPADAAVLTLRLGADGLLHIDGRPLTLADLPTALAGRGKTPVVIAADPDAALQSLVTLLDVLAAVGVRDPVLR